MRVGSDCEVGEPERLEEGGSVCGQCDWYLCASRISWGRFLTYDCAFVYTIFLVMHSIALVSCIAFGKGAGVDDVELT